MRTMTSFQAALAGIAALAYLGCAHSVPAELLSARAAYQRSSEGPAADLVPAELHKARVALAAAEQSFEDAPDSYRTRDLAYVAQRTSERADALAGIDADRRSTAQSDDSFSTMQGEIITRTETDLRDARTDLSQSQMALMAALARLAAVKEEDRGLVITLSGSVLFRSGEHALLPAAQTRLDQVAEALLTSRERKLVVEGHTDSQGTHRANMLLSQRRADAVRDYLIGNGYASHLIVAEGLGQGRPVADNATPEGRSNNRRVEIVIERTAPTQSLNRPPRSRIASGLER